MEHIGLSAAQYCRDHDRVVYVRWQLVLSKRMDVKLMSYEEYPWPPQEKYMQMDPMAEDLQGEFIKAFREIWK